MQLMNIEWNAENYRQNFSFVPAYGEDVMKLLTVKPNSNVVDLGCGNGTLTAKLNTLGYNVTGIDASTDMLSLARKNYPDINFVQGDAISFRLSKPADAIFSNAVMHWIDADKQQATLDNIAANLRQGGEFVFEFGGYGCAEAVHSMLEQIFREHGRQYLRMFYFPTIGMYAPMVEKSGMRVEYAVLFDRPTPQKGGRTVKDWIKMFDIKPFADISAEEAEVIMDEAEKHLRPKLYQQGIWYVDYVRIRMRARKI